MAEVKFSFSCSTYYALILGVNGSINCEVEEVNVSLSAAYSYARLAGYHIPRASCCNARLRIEILLEFQG